MGIGPGRNTKEGKADLLHQLDAPRAEQVFSLDLDDDPGLDVYVGIHALGVDLQG